MAVRNAQLYEDLQRQADRDPLTEVLNHRAYYERLAQELARAHRAGSSVGVLVLDLDDFKSINDVRGHLVGDRALRDAAAAIAARAACCDVAGRLGGDEFGVILPDIGDGGRAGGAPGAGRGRRRAGLSALDRRRRVGARRDRPACADGPRRPSRCWRQSGRASARTGWLHERATATGRRAGGAAPAGRRAAPVADGDRRDGRPGRGPGATRSSAPDECTISSWERDADTLVGAVRVRARRRHRAQTGRASSTDSGRLAGEPGRCWRPAPSIASTAGRRRRSSRRCASSSRSGLGRAGSGFPLVVEKPRGRADRAGRLRHRRRDGRRGTSAFCADDRRPGRDGRAKRPAVRGSAAAGRSRLADRAAQPPARCYERVDEELERIRRSGRPASWRWSRRPGRLQGWSTTGEGHLAGDGLLRQVADVLRAGAGSRTMPPGGWAATSSAVLPGDLEGDAGRGGRAAGDG